MFYIYVYTVQEDMGVLVGEVPVEAWSFSDPTVSFSIYHSVSGWVDPTFYFGKHFPAKTNDDDEGACMYIYIYICVYRSVLSVRRGIGIGGYTGAADHRGPT